MEENTSNDPVIWRCLSYKTLSGGMNQFHNAVMFDDMMSAERLTEYFLDSMEKRGVDKVIVKRLGTLSFVLENAAKLGFNKIRSGADRIANEKKNHKLEDFLNQFPLVKGGEQTDMAVDSP